MAGNAFSEPNEFTASSTTEPNAKGDLNGPLCYIVIPFMLGFSSQIFLQTKKKRARETGTYYRLHFTYTELRERGSKTHRGQK